jgi:hypothetical protein
MSDNINETYKGVPLKKYEGKISDLGYKSEAEAVEYALKKFNAAVSKINIEIFGYDIDFPK